MMRPITVETEMPKTLPKGHTSLLSSEFRYRHSKDTDIAATFKRVREERAAAAKRERESVKTNIRPFVKVAT